MILDQTDNAGTPATLDDLFRRAGVRHPQELALVDPDNREHFTDHAPRRLTYAQADRAISAIAARLRAFNLPTDAVVALQLPNTVESVLALLGVLRAGMIAAPLPLLWHRADATAALRSTGAKALLTCARAGPAAQAEIATQVAADVFSIRHVCAFGTALPDGVAPLDDVFSADAEAKPVVPRLADPSAHIAVVTFDVTASGIVPLARNHRQLIAGGLGLCAVAELAPDARILSAIPLGSFAGIATTLLPWLMSGGTLTLHHSFDAISFAAQTCGHDFDAIVLPGAAMPRLAEAGLLAAAKTAIALWRAPERKQRAAPCQAGGSIVDVASFGDLGIVATRRGADGMPAPLPVGRVKAPEGGDAMPLIEIARSALGTVMVRGLMVPASGFPFGTKPHHAMTAGGFIDSGHPCRFAADAQALVVTAPPAGIASVGSYRFAARELDHLAESLAADATLVVLPQELTGERLAGHAPDRAPVAEELRRRGVNPLITSAFSRQQAA
jgi:non-ribosomal peptide synthetase component E (peptide arylation enzyme)